MSTFDPDNPEWILFNCRTYVPMTVYQELLQLYRQEQVKSANAVFLEQTDAAIIEAEHIKLPEGVKLP